MKTKNQILPRMLTGSNSALYLNSEELSNLYCKNVRNYKKRAVKEMLVFSCLSGLNSEEIMILRKSNIKVLPDDKKVLEIKRVGEISTALIPICERMQSIIHYYNGYHKNARKGRLFPTYSNKDINETLVYLSAYSRIYKPLSFLLARRTYTVHQFIRGTNVDTIKLSLGHKEVKSTYRFIILLMREIFQAKNIFSIQVKSHTNGK